MLRRAPIGKLGYQTGLATTRPRNAKKGAAVPMTLWFAPIVPNPASSGALVRLGLPREGQVSLVLFDANGRRLRGLAGRAMPAGEHSLRWDGLDENGRRVASGLYFMRLETTSGSRVQRFAVIR